MKKLVAVLLATAFLFVAISGSAKCLKTTEVSGDVYGIIARIYQWDNDPWLLHVLILTYKTEKDPDFFMQEYVVSARLDSKDGWVYKGPGYRNTITNLDGGRPHIGSLSMQETDLIHTIVQFYAGWEECCEK